MKSLSVIIALGAAAWILVFLFGWLVLGVLGVLFS